MLEASLDTTRGLWAPLSPDHPDCMTADLLLEGCPLTPTELPFVSLVALAKDFSLLGLLAIHTGQWIRPDLLSALMTLQATAERHSPKAKTKTP
jgi:hypothetical protein